MLRSAASPGCRRGVPSRCAAFSRARAGGVTAAPPPHRHHPPPRAPMRTLRRRPPLPTFAPRWSGRPGPTTSRTCGSLHRRSTAPPPPSRRSYTAAAALLPPGATAPRPSPSGRHRAPLVTATLAEPHRGRFHAAATSDPFWGVRSPSHPPPGLALQAAAILRVAPLPPAPSTRDPRVSRGWSSLCTVAASACRLSAEAARGGRAGVRAATPTAEGLRGLESRHSLATGTTAKLEKKPSCARSKGRHARAGGKGHLTHAFPLEKIRNKLREAELSDLGLTPIRYSRPKRLPRNGVPGRPPREQGS